MKWAVYYAVQVGLLTPLTFARHCPTTPGLWGPSGSVLGPLLFVLYTQPISRIIRQSGSDLHKFSDDTQLFSSSLPADFGTLIKQTETCVEHVKA